MLQSIALVATVPPIAPPKNPVKLKTPMPEPILSRGSSKETSLEREDCIKMNPIFGSMRQMATTHGPKPDNTERQIKPVIINDAAISITGMLPNRSVHFPPTRPNNAAAMAAGKSTNPIESAVS